MDAKLQKHLSAIKKNNITHKEKNIDDVYMLPEIIINETNRSYRPMQNYNNQQESSESSEENIEIVQYIRSYYSRR